jgi:predicted SAM-dependent methyltransferase
MNVTDAEKPIKLHLGCGSVHLKDHVNIDIQDWAGACDIVADATNLEMYPDGSVDHIFSHALLEHIPPWNTMKALQEWYRVLKPGGTIRIDVPDLEQIFEGWLVNGTVTDKVALNNIFGGNKHPDKAYEAQHHLTGFTFCVLVGYLIRCGFVCFEQLEDPQYVCMLIVTARKPEK